MESISIVPLIKRWYYTASLMQFFHRYSFLCDRRIFHVITLRWSIPDKTLSHQEEEKLQCRLCVEEILTSWWFWKMFVTSFPFSGLMKSYFCVIHVFGTTGSRFSSKCTLKLYRNNFTKTMAKREKVIFLLPCTCPSKYLGCYGRCCILRIYRNNGIVFPLYIHTLSYWTLKSWQPAGQDNTFRSIYRLQKFTILNYA